MLIDFHTHVFPDKIAESTISFLAKNSGTRAYTDGTAEGLIKEMERAEADVCVTLPVLTKASQFDSISRFAIQLNEKYKNQKKRLISFGGLHPDCDHIKEKIKFLKENGIKGIKIHPDYQGTFIDDEKYYKIVSAAKDYDMIVVTHAGVDYGYKDCPVRCPPDLVKKLYKRVPYNKLVLAHYGGHKEWKEVSEELCDVDCYFDTAFTFHEIEKDRFIEILNKRGADKVLFATDCPWRGIKEDKELLLSYNLDKNVLDAIFYKNASKLLDLEIEYENK